MKVNSITPELLGEILSTLKINLQVEENKDDKITRKIYFLIAILELISENKDYNPKLYPTFHHRFENPSFEHHIKQIINKEVITLPENLDWLLLTFIRLLREILLSLQRKDSKKPYTNNEKVSKYQKIWDGFNHNISSEQIHDFYQRDFFYIKNDLGIDILNSYLEKEGFCNFTQSAQNADHKAQKLQRDVEQANLELKEIEQRLEKAQKELENYRQGVNFVLLHQGFGQLLKKKENSKSCMFWLLCFTGLLIVIMPFYKIVSETSWAAIAWQQLLIGIGLEFVLIYFFRVILNQYRANEAQIMQLELRQTLCQFIEEYIKFSRKNKVNDKGEKDADALEKFENLIFSSILSNDNNIPSTFDGMEQVTQLIKELKSKP